MTAKLPKLTAEVDPYLTEYNYGFACLCYEDDEYVTKFVFAERDDAEVAKERWEAGEASLRHLALKRMEMEG